RAAPAARLPLGEPAGVPPSLKGRAAEVMRVTGVIVGGVQTDILIIDPDTFARDAFWDERPIGMPLSEAMDIVRGGAAVGAWPLHARDLDITTINRAIT